jgi:hypothetical protein
VVAVVRDYFDIGVTGVECRLENLYLLACELGSLETTDEFLGLTGEH